jgi:hypothetical protein
MLDSLIRGNLTSWYAKNNTPVYNLIGQWYWWGNLTSWYAKNNTTVYNLIGQSYWWGNLTSWYAKNNTTVYNLIGQSVIVLYLQYFDQWIFMFDRMVTTVEWHLPRGLLFQLASTIKIQLSVLVSYKADIIIISTKCNLFLPWYCCKIDQLPLNNIHSLTENYYFLFLIMLWYYRPKIGLNFIDHIVGNQPEEDMVPVSDWLVDIICYYILSQIIEILLSSYRQEDVNICR